MNHTLLTVGLVLAAVALFVAACVGAAALDVFPTASDVGDANGEARDTDDVASAAEADVSTTRDDTDERGGSRITAADHERIRKHLEKERHHRSPDDLLPSDDDGS